MGTVFSKSNLKVTDVDINLYIGNQKITKTSSCKYLGVTLDENLSWKVHIDYVYSKLLKFTGIFYKVRDFIPADC